MYKSICVLKIKTKEPEISKSLIAKSIAERHLSRLSSNKMSFRFFILTPTIVVLAFCSIEKSICILGLKTKEPKILTSLIGGSI